MARAVLASLALLLASLASSASVAAVGTSQPTATPIAEGTFTGTVPYDGDHWYRVAVPAGKVMNVAFTVTAGDSWSSLDVVDSGGAYLAFIYSGDTRAYDPDEAYAWLRVDAYWGEVGYAFTVTFTDAPAQDDAGSGLDAGGRQASALPVQAGVIHGRVRRDAGDYADWYRIQPPAGLVLDLHSAVGADVSVVSAQGRELERVDDYWGPVSYGLLTTGEPIYFRVDYGDAYSFVLTLSNPANLRVTGIEVRDVPLETDNGPAGVAYAREVAVTIANVGAGPSRQASLRVLATHDGPATSHRVVGTRALALAAGESATLVLPWDATGEVGDVKLVATVAAELELDAGNNVGHASAFVLARGSPVDADLLNHEASAQGKRVRVEYGGDSAGASTPVGYVGFDRGVLTLP